MGHAPENTLRSILKALELGAAFVEIDVYWVDDHLMVIHDDRLERTTNGSGLVMEHTFDELRSLDAGIGEPIPTLDEIADLIGGKAGLNIELKGPGTAEPVHQFIAERVEAGWDKRSFLVSSFDHQELFNLRALDPDVQLGVICRTASPSELDFTESLQAASINPAHESVQAPFVKDAHARTIMVFAYTVNEPGDLARMHELGVDGVFTNYPERVLEHYRQQDRSGIWPTR